MPKFPLRQDVEQIIRNFIENDIPMLQEQLGIDHSIPGCPVVNVDPYGVGVGTFPRYIQVALRGEYYYDVYYRGGIPGLAVGDELTIKYLSEGKRWEVEGPSGSGGTAYVDIHDHSSNTEGGQYLHQLLELEVDDPTELTINAGVVTRTQVYHTIDTQGGAAADDLDTVNGGVTGDLLIIKPEDGARTVTVRHNVGNIWLMGGADVDLDDINDHMMLVYDGTMWCGIGAGGGGGGAAGEWLALNAGNLDFEPDRPAVVDTAGAVTEYATIAAAIAGAVATDMVVIPPGTYDEALTLKAGVRIVELFTDTVVINRTSGNVAITCADGGYIDVYEISVTRNTNTLVATIDTNNTPTAGNTCVVRARRLTATNNAETSNAKATIVDIDDIDGELNIYADIAESYCGYRAYYLYCGSDAGTGELNMYVKHVEVESVNWTGVGIQLGGSTGTLTINIWGGDIYQVATSANIYGIAASKNTFNLYNVRWYAYSSSANIYLLYTYGDAAVINCYSCHFYADSDGGAATVRGIWQTYDAEITIWNFSMYIESGGTGEGVNSAGGAENGVIALYNGWISATTTDIAQTAGTVKLYSVKHYTTSGQIMFEGQTGINNFTVGGAAVTIVPNATGDVAAILTALYAVSESAGGTSGGTATVTPGGSVNLYNDGVDVLALAVAAGGNVTLQRTAGAATFDVSLNMVWI